jgi:hypothetical protein
VSGRNGKVVNLRDGPARQRWVCNDCTRELPNWRALQRHRRDECPAEVRRKLAGGQHPATCCEHAVSVVQGGDIRLVAKSCCWCGPLSLDVLYDGTVYSEEKVREAAGKHGPRMSHTRRAPGILLP